jgi:hypothetical protein
MLEIPMPLYQTFIALNFNDPNARLSGEALHTIKHTNITPADLKTAISSPPEAQPPYQDFLAHCKQALHQHTHVALQSIVTTWLQKIHHLSKRFQLLGFNPNKESALSIVPLGIQFIDSPEAFSAFVSWLISCGVTPKKLLETHLIQDYFRYHALDLDAADNPITRLHTCLANAPETRRLAENLNKTGCPENGLSFYALNGTKQSVSDLNYPKRTFTRWQGPITEPHFFALEQVFSTHFLQFALEYLPSNTIPLSHALNFDAQQQKPQHIPEILRNMQTNNRLMRALAGYLSTQSFDALISTRTHSIFNLLPYATYLREQINRTDLKNYLHTLQHKAFSSEDAIFDLSRLLNVFKTENKPHALIIFSALIQQLLKAPEFIEDDYLLRQLRQFSAGYPILLTRLIHLITEFEQMLQTKLSSANFDYIPIEDMWRKTLEQINALQAIHEHPLPFPKDKHMLHATLAKHLFQHKRFQLHTFVEAVGIEPVFHANQITPYERLLVNLLVALDAHALRREIITRLDQQITPQNNWKTKAYSGISLFHLAAQHGNLGFILWLQSQKFALTTPTEALIKVTAEAGHWLLVKYFQETASSNQQLVNDLLTLAIKQEAADAIPYLWCHKRYTPSRISIEKNFMTAITQKKTLCAEALLTCKTPLTDTILIKAFKVAIRTDQLPLAKHIAEAHAETHLQDAINYMLLEVARADKPNLIQFLGGLTTNPITQDTLDLALQRAVRAKRFSATKALCCLPHLMPRAEAKKQALTTAKKTSQENVIQLLSAPELPVRNPTPLSALSLFVGRLTPEPLSPLRFPSFYQQRSP